MMRVVVDLGNSRLKWGLVGSGGILRQVRALPLDGPDAWAEVLASWDADRNGSAWAISTVNPPVAERLARFLDEHAVGSIRWFRSAADVPVDHELSWPEATGADRALAVCEAIRSKAPRCPCLVIACGTAITIERVSAEGLWYGGSIAPGLALAAKALHQGTAQLPPVVVSADPPAWGRSTTPAIEAGVFWGAVGAIRELIVRQGEGLSPAPERFWTGGDAALLAPAVDGSSARIVPDLVLCGLARLAFGGEAGPP